MVKSVYIHIPFCKNICSYCNFCKMYYNEKMASIYLDALYLEIVNNYKGEKVSTIYIGGGTPSDLSISNLKKLFKIIEIFNKDEKCEFSFECNVDIEKEKLILLKDNQVNRLSFGIETISKKNLKIIDRNHNKKIINDKIKLCRDIGFSNINGDLMYAFDNETMEELKNDINFMLSLNLEHISTYSLIIEKHTKLYLNGAKNCDEDLDYKMYKTIHNLLLKNGYIHYEVSNFSKNNFSSLHNLTYWKNEEYYGFGLSASGYIDNIRYTNTKSFNNYIQGIYKYEVEKLDKYDKINYEIILGLRLRNGVNLKNFFHKYNVNIEDLFFINDYLSLGYLIKNDNLYIPYNKWYVMNSILERFVK